ncbi:hypothetical protein DGG96_02085 [Legionella qingyii]|uniref:Uncharacterized protein n=1 Tax=Legionella qingyii TaxID=2184757 RepID=A0A317U3G5_9GAMM|nr:hypothetical protein [Legionella qingyii]PWY56523.1 hypothetical protein DGG96_07105 [Legionella qingyii]PWY57120.1 hypothetical protein DGG96_02085 [Legionella qingyii]RUR25040.1 hypothetical protein ELY20_04590 [Legionella qingyii]RUR28688.1 hypothetical protein ELY16_01390 [Legionella qingyii]
MFEWLKSAFKKAESNDGVSDITHLKQQKETSNYKESQSTWVYIWNMTAQGPGHAAIQIGGSKPKMNEEDPGEYISIHPNSIPSMGPTVVLPLPAHLATTLAEDMESEAISRGKSNINDFDSRPNLSTENPEPLPPDQTFKIENLDTEAMLNHIHKIEDTVQTGKTSYQLFPNINLNGFFKDMPSFINQDPIDVEINRRLSSKYAESDNQTTNCSVLVSDILDSGGKHIVKSKLPWGISPNGLSDSLNKGP